MKKPDETPMTQITLTADEVRDLYLVQGVLGTGGWTGLQASIRRIAVRADPDGFIIPKKNS